MRKYKVKIRADTFDVFGKPPDIVGNALRPRATNALKRYVDRVVKKVYRIAYDAGRHANQAAHD